MRTALSIGIAVVLVSGLARPAQAAFTRAPWIQDTTADSVTIAWEAGTAGGTQQVQWGAGTATNQTTDGTLVSSKLYTAKLTGLPSSSNFSYKVVSGADTSAPAGFLTAPAGSEPFRFGAYGDNRTDATAHAAVITGLVNAAPDFVINTGDLSDAGNYTQFMSIEAPLISKTTLFPSPGNHDGSGTAYQYGFDRPSWYSYRWGNAFFIAISTEDAYTTGSTQYAWVEQQLSTAKADPTINWVFVYHHFPVYSSSSHGSTADMQTSLNNLYKQYAVDIVFNGHDHDYERSEKDGVVYVVAGGGGAPLYGAGSSCPGHIFSESVNSFVTVDIDGGNLDLKAWRADGTMMDERQIQKSVAPGSTPTPEPTATPGGNPGGNAGNGSETVHGSGFSCDVSPLAGTLANGASAAMLLGALALLLRRRTA